MIITFVISDYQGLTFNKIFLEMLGYNLIFIISYEIAYVANLRILFLFSAEFGMGADVIKKLYSF